jgi:hypothetical protein
MTSGRLWLIAAALSTTAVALSAACGASGSPCTSCPPLEGRYTVAFAAGETPDDCAALGVTLPQGPLDIQRAGAGLTATWEEVELQGTLYQSLDFTLLGAEVPLDGGRTQFSLNGRYMPGSADGGVGALSGSFSGSYTRASPQGQSDCSIVRPFTAAQHRQP